jgi:hypothetical protein
VGIKEGGRGVVTGGRCWGDECVPAEECEGGATLVSAWRRERERERERLLSKKDVKRVR